MTPPKKEKGEIKNWELYLKQKLQLKLSKSSSLSKWTMCKKTYILLQASQGSLDYK